jgi:DNA-binding MarR family transcriptional regulator
VAAKRVPDPTEQSVWRPMRLLFDAMDADIARLYTEADLGEVRPSFVLELIRLHLYGPMTITELARSVERTHSAVSQKVAAMRTAGLVRTTVGADARSRRVALTAKARRITARLAAEWRATEASVLELEAELPYPLTQVVADIEAALARRSWHDRIAGKLAEDPDWGEAPPARRGPPQSPRADSEIAGPGPCPGAIVSP